MKNISLCLWVILLLWGILSLFLWKVVTNRKTKISSDAKKTKLVLFGFTAYSIVFCASMHYILYEKYLFYFYTFFYCVSSMAIWKSRGKWLGIFQFASFFFLCIISLWGIFGDKDIFLLAMLALAFLIIASIENFASALYYIFYYSKTKK